MNVYKWTFVPSQVTSWQSLNVIKGVTKMINCHNFASGPGKAALEIAYV